jgi:hypothetical protein
LTSFRQGLAKKRKAKKLTSFGFESKAKWFQPLKHTEIRPTLPQTTYTNVCQKFQRWDRATSWIDRGLSLLERPLASGLAVQCECDCTRAIDQSIFTFWKFFFNNAMQIFLAFSHRIRILTLHHFFPVFAFLNRIKTLLAFPIFNILVLRENLLQSWSLFSFDLKRIEMGSIKLFWSPTSQRI